MLCYGAVVYTVRSCVIINEGESVYGYAEMVPVPMHFRSAGGVNNLIKMGKKLWMMASWGIFG